MDVIDINLGHKSSPDTESKKFGFCTSLIILPLHIFNVILGGLKDASPYKDILQFPQLNLIGCQAKNPACILNTVTFPHTGHSI